MFSDLYILYFIPLCICRQSLRNQIKSVTHRRCPSLGFQMTLTLANSTIPYVWKIFGFVTPISQYYQSCQGSVSFLSETERIKYCVVVFAQKAKPQIQWPWDHTLTLCLFSSARELWLNIRLRNSMCSQQRENAIVPADGQTIEECR